MSSYNITKSQLSKRGIGRSVFDTAVTCMKFADRTCWYNKDGQLDRKFGPAVQYNNGDYEYWSNGQLHRESSDGPAIKQGKRKEWRENGVLHRKDGPAVIDNNYSPATKLWFYKGELHRLDGPACEYSEGRREWRVHGKKHRESSEGPAVITGGGIMSYWINNKKHCEDGPAVVFPNNPEDNEYWLNGKDLKDKEQHEYYLNKIIKRNRKH